MLAWDKKKPLVYAVFYAWSLPDSKAVFYSDSMRF